MKYYQVAALIIECYFPLLYFILQNYNFKCRSSEFS